MTLDEAIKHCEEKADELNKQVLNQANLCNAREMAECQECAREHEQLAEWLKDYKRLLGEKSYAMGFQDGVEDGLQGLRPEGEWVYGEDECGQDGWFCSECGFFVPWYYEYYEKDIDFIREYKACPHCLAEMVTYTGKDRDTKGGTK